MSNSFHDFLTWFDGWAENIGTRPTPKQWDRLRAKVAAIREAAPQTVMVAPSVTSTEDAADESPRVKKPKTWTKQSWRAAYIKALEEIGYDAESAGEMFGSLKNFDPHSDPAVAAKFTAAATAVN